MFDIWGTLFFWIPVATIAYHWILFPFILWVWGKVRPRRYAGEKRPQEFAVTIAVAVYNEEPIVEQKVRNCLELEHPPDMLEILVGSDASTDRTDELVRGFNDPRVRLVRYNEQAGKTVVLNRLIELAKGEIVLATDADALLTPESLRLMLEHMRDPKVAVVNPRYLRVNEDGSPAESIYDKWETKLKELEGRLGAMVACNAWANMIRRSAAEHIEDDTILDDFVLGIRPFRHGLDVVNEPRATVFTQTETEQLEWKRKARISGGNLQALLRHVDLLHPRYGRKAWVYFSHKVIRMYIPFLLFTMLVGSAIKIGEPFFAVLFALQAAVLATVPLLWTVRDKLRKLLIPQYYYYINIALVVGYWRYFFRPERYWKKTPRKGEYGTSR